MKISPIKPDNDTLELLRSSPIGMHELWTPEGFTTARAPVSLAQFDPEIFGVELPHTHRCADETVDYVYNARAPLDDIESLELPDELSHFREFLGVAFGAEIAISPLLASYVGVIRIKQKIEAIGTAMNEATHIHFDMFTEPGEPKSRQVIAAGPGNDTTGCYNQAFDVSNAPSVTSSNSIEIDRFAHEVFVPQADPENIVYPRPGESVMVDTLTPHFAPVSTTVHLRTFARVTFSIRK